MGAWGVLAFDNDTACDWSYGLDDVDDLSLVTAAIDSVVEVGDGYLDADVASELLAACEVLARLRGLPGYNNAYTENVDKWVAIYKVEPPEVLLQRARMAIDRVVTEPSELMELWSEGDDTEWRKAVDDLRQRLA